MKYKDYSVWAATHLQPVAYTVCGMRVAAWSGGDARKPCVVLVHGIGGDHSGMVPLAEALIVSCRVVLVDLAGHGDSDMLPDVSIEAYWEWMADVLAAIERDHGRVSTVCGHSFGALVVAGAARRAPRTTVLVTPVPWVPKVYRIYGRCVAQFGRLTALGYNLSFWVWLRGVCIAKQHFGAPFARVRWVGRTTKASYRQVVYQLRLSSLVMNGDFYSQLQLDHRAVVLRGRGDTMVGRLSKKRRLQYFGDVEVVSLRGGHLLPIESPRLVARYVTASTVI